MSDTPNAAAQTADFEFAALNAAKNYRSALLREFAEPLRGQVLEVGAGIGQITAMLWQNPAITKLVSIEPDANFCAQFRAAWPAQQLIEGTIDDLPGAESWNAILSVNVLEHIADDVDALRRMRQLATPGGRVIVFVPALPCIYGQMDKAMGHHRRYTLASLKKAYLAAGLKPVKGRYMNIVGAPAWWWQGRARKKDKLSAPATLAFDRLVPILSAIERLLWVPFGQSVYLVGRA